MRIGLSVRITLYSVRWNARSVKFEIHFQPSGTVQVQHRKPSVRCRVSPVDRLSIGFQAVKSIQITTFSGPSETDMPTPADEPAAHRAQDVPGAAPEHLIPRAAAPEAVSFRPRFFVKTGISRGPWKTPARDFCVWKSPSLGPNAARLTSGDYLASIQTMFLFILQTHTPMLDLTLDPTTDFGSSKMSLMSVSAALCFSFLGSGL